MQSLFVLKETEIDYNGNFTSIGDRAVGVISNYSYGKSFDDAVIQGIVKIEESGSIEQNVGKLLNGRVRISRVM